MINVELTPEEAQNVHISLVAMSKSNNVDVNGMKILLNLSDKFAQATPEVVEEAEEDVKEE